MNQIYEPTPGCTIDRAIREAMELAVGSEFPTEFTFNGVRLLVNEESNPSEIQQHLSRTQELVAKAYDTPLRRLREADRRATEQQMLDSLMVHLPTLNMKNHEAVLNWLCGLEMYGGTTYSRFDRGAVLSTFRDAGFHPGDNIKEAEETVDEWRLRVGREGEFRWIVGQALEGIRDVGCPHQLIHKFTEDFLKGNQ